MSDNLLDDLDGILSAKESGDETFRNELSYYNGIKGVQVDSTIHDVYNRKAGVATTAARIIKSDKSSIKNLTRGIKDQEERLTTDTTSLRELTHEIRKAKREWKDTSILDFEKSSQAKQKYKHLLKQFQDRNKGKRRLKERIVEDKSRLEEKQFEIKTQKVKLTEAKSYMEKLEKGVRAQFETVNKLLATKEYIKSGNIDLNDPRLDAQTKNAIVRFSQLLKDGLKISIDKPLTKQDSEIMQIFHQVETAMKETDKKAIEQNSQKRLTDCKDYVKRLQKDPSLDALDDSGR